MRSKIIAALCATSLLGLVGCGGGTTDTLPNRYAGVYTGSWSSATQPDSGTLTWTIDATGALTGSMTRASDAGTATVTGIVRRSGEFSATADFAGLTDYTISGTLTQTGSEVTVVFDYVYLGSDYSATGVLR